MKVKETSKKIMQNQDVSAFLKELKQKRTKIFLMAVGFRLTMYILSVVIMVMSESFEAGMSFRDFLESWRRWDANGYLSIAENGYSGWVENDMYVCLVFFPLFPWLIKFVALFVGQYTLAGIITSTICYGIACVYIYKLLCEEYTDEIAENSIISMSIFPFAFFLGCIMTESLFVAILAAFFYHLRKHNWWIVSILGFFACLTKVQGVLLALPIFVELVYEKKAILLLKQRNWKSLWHDIMVPGLLCVPMFLGIGVYLYINYHVAGNPFIFLEYQKNNWGNSMLNIFSTISYVQRNAAVDWHTSTAMCIWIPESILFFVYIGAIIYGIVKKMKPSYLSYLIIFFIITYSSSWLISGGRYTISALPLFMIEGIVLTKRPKWKLPIWGISIALFMVYYMGYLTKRVIM